MEGEQIYHTTLTGLKDKPTRSLRLSANIFNSETTICSFIKDVFLSQITKIGENLEHVNSEANYIKDTQYKTQKQAFF